LWLKLTDKWKKVCAKILCWQGLNFTLRMCKIKDIENCLDSLSLSSGLEISDIEKESDKRYFVILKGERKNITLASDSSGIITAWCNLFDCIVKLVKDPTRSENISEKVTELLASYGTEDSTLVWQKLEDLGTGILSEEDLQKIKQELTDLRNSIWLVKVNQCRERLNGLTVKVQEIRDRIIYELLTTEHTYVANLYTLLHVFKNLVKKFQKEIGIDDMQISILFGNLEEIFQCHSILLDDLILCFTEWTSKTILSTHLKKALQSVKTYRNYAANFDNANNLLVSLSKRTVTKKFF
jgi:hypothetical protein